jgi:hypothetical protein
MRPVYGAARLNINRIPDLGNFVIVRLWIDGMWAGSIGYGHTYEGLLSPGRHVLTVLAGPNPKWWIPSQLILDVQSGQTSFLLLPAYGPIVDKFATKLTLCELPIIFWLLIWGAKDQSLDKQHPVPGVA